MKRLFVALCALALTTAVSAQTNTASNTVNGLKQKKQMNWSNLQKPGTILGKLSRMFR